MKRRPNLDDCECGYRYSRRDFLGGCVTAAIASLAAQVPAGAWQAPSNARSTGIIDVHHHAMPPNHLAKKRDHIRSYSSTRAFEEWTVGRSLDVMDQAGVATAMVSLSTPGVWTGNVEESRADARDTNEFIAQMVRDHPTRFGLLATLPFPDVEGSLKEIAYAYDVLRADGIGLMTNYDDRYPGDPLFDPILQELNRRRAVVYLHPTNQACCSNPLPHVFPAIVEFPFDTTRAAMSLLYANAFARYPDIKFIFSHGGGTIPFLAGRIGALSQRSSVTFPQGAEHELKKAYFEMTSATSPTTMAATLRFATAGHMLAGTDYPFGANPIGGLEALTKAGLSSDDVRAIQYGTALTMFPRLKA